MASWTSPRTWVSELVTSTLLNAHLRDNLKAAFPTDQMAWTSYTPTFTQSATISKTVTYAKYFQVGKLVVVEFSLSATSSGTSNNAVLIGLPVTAAATTTIPIGSGYIFDGGGNVPGLPYLASTTTMGFIDSTQKVAVVLGQTGAAFSAAITSGMSVNGHAIYEAA